VQILPYYRDSWADVHCRGIGVHLFVNGKNVCSSIPIYSKTESRGKDETEHFTIKEMQACNNSVQLKTGDILQIKADYDVEKYPQ
jgi:Stress up-regulated Nod 19